MSFHSEFVTYSEVNPDPMFGACRNTELAEDGCTFLGLEPLEGTFTYIGRTSLVEAAALLFGLTPSEVNERLTGPAPTKRKQRKEPNIT